VNLQTEIQFYVHTSSNICKAAMLFGRNTAIKSQGRKLDQKSGGYVWIETPNASRRERCEEGCPLLSRRENTFWCIFSLKEHAW